MEEISGHDRREQQRLIADEEVRAVQMKQNLSSHPFAQSEAVSQARCQQRRERRPARLRCVRVAEAQAQQQELSTTPPFCWPEVEEPPPLLLSLDENVPSNMFHR